MKYLFSAALLFFLLAASCDKQPGTSATDTGPHYRVMFYNTENLFDTEDDPAVNDQEFLPGSSKKWTEERYRDKIRHIAKVIGDVGGDTLPALVGLCEVENRKTLDDLIHRTQLDGTDYAVVHRESPDARGIDVALLYRKGYFRLLSNRFIRINYPEDAGFRTRDILYARGVMGGLDTLHVFVNHWPSRSGGEVKSRPLRLFVAAQVRACVDSIWTADPGARILIMGDFNDEPDDLSVTSGLKALLSCAHILPDELYDLTPGLRNSDPGGTYKYKGAWNLLDHMVVSGSLMDTTRPLHAGPSDFHVFMADYLVEEDPGNLGVRPKRTYLGSYYQGGYSDHLPVYLDLFYRNVR